LEEQNVSAGSLSLKARLAVAFTIFYCVALLGVSLWVSVRAYEWGRLRGLQTISLTEAPAVQADGQSVNSAGAAASADQASVAAVPQSNPAANGHSALLPAINILLLGTDARPDESATRTDTMILLTLDQQSGVAGMLSLPRDLWVPIPEFNLNAKINTAYTLGEENRYEGGGAQLAKNTVGSFVGQPVDYYVRVNFRGFVELLDLIGGVEIDVPYTIHDEEYPTADYGVETFHLDAGRQHLDGETALKYVRTRHTDSDFGRARRQQQLLRAVLDKVLRLNMIPQLLTQLPTFVYTMRSSIDTDMQMTTQLQLATYLSQHPPQEVRTLVLDDQYGEAKVTEDWGWILQPDRQKVREALRQFFQPMSNSSAVDEQLPTAVAAVRIELLNGTSESGVAARTRELLEARGWQVVAIGDADRSDYRQTQVINYGAPDQVVQKVGATLNLQPQLAHAPPTSTAVDLRIVLGSDVLSKIK
jgi:LCP family protein required for cell wall assembly